MPATVQETETAVRKSPAERAQDALGVCDRKIARATERRAVALQQADLARKVLDDLQAERTYLAASPALVVKVAAPAAEVPGQTDVYEQVAEAELTQADREAAPAWSDEERALVEEEELAALAASRSAANADG